jgi:hypothetical protein
MNRGDYVWAVPVDASVSGCFGVLIKKVGPDRIRVQMMSDDQPGQPGEVKECRYRGARVFDTQHESRVVHQFIKRVCDSLPKREGKADALRRRVAGSYGTGKRR